MTRTSRRMAKRLKIIKTPYVEEMMMLARRRWVGTALAAVMVGLVVCGHGLAQDKPPAVRRPFGPGGAGGPGGALEREGGPRRVEGQKPDREVEAWIKVLIEKVADRHDTIRESARQALASIGQPALPALRRLADSDDSAVATAARTVIGRIERGPLGPPMIAGEGPRGVGGAGPRGFGEGPAFTGGAGQGGSGGRGGFGGAGRGTGEPVPGPGGAGERGRRPEGDRPGERRPEAGPGEPRRPPGKPAVGERRPEGARPSEPGRVPGKPGEGERRPEGPEGPGRRGGGVGGPGGPGGPGGGAGIIGGPVGVVRQALSGVRLEERQKERVEAILKEHQASLNEIRERVRGGGEVGPDIRARMEKLFDALRGVLNEEQMNKLRESMPRGPGKPEEKPR